MRRIVTWSMGAVALALLGSCTVAEGLSRDEILEEIQAIVRVEAGAGTQQLSYADEAVVMHDYMRMWALGPVRWPLGWAFGRRGMRRLPSSAYHVRELLRELPEETRGGWLGEPALPPCATGAAWCAWFATLDPSAATRIVALDGLSRISEQLGLAAFDGSFAEIMQAMDPAAAAAARRRVQAAQDSGDEAALAGALAEWTMRPLGVVSDRILLVEELTAMLAGLGATPERRLVEDALRAALGHCVRGVLLDSIDGRSRELAEVRLCGMEQVRRLGGARTVPLMLAVMAASPAERANGVPHYDPDTLVQLRLIHYCGQLSEEKAAEVVRVPGRQEWEATTAAEFLARTILRERDYYSKLRVPALVALTWCLGRPRVDPDPAWVREWLGGRGS